MKSKLIVSALIISGGVLLFGALGVGAQTATDPHSQIIKKLTEKFKLKEADVKAVFDEEKTARRAQMESRLLERLNQAVKDGKLTEAQKQAIINKVKELKSKSEGRRGELEVWAKQNGIDLSLLSSFHMKQGWMRMHK